MLEDVTTELPRWICHKQVHAFKITKIERDDVNETATLYHDEGYFVPIKVNYEYMTKHNPQVGGYYVLYHDGYQSWSPAKAFEEGYTRETFSSRSNKGKMISIYTMILKKIKRFL